MFRLLYRTLVNNLLLFTIHPHVSAFISNPSSAVWPENGLGLKSAKKTQRFTGKTTNLFTDNQESYRLIQ